MNRSIIEMKHSSYTTKVNDIQGVKWLDLKCSEFAIIVDGVAYEPNDYLRKYMKENKNVPMGLFFENIVKVEG